MLLDANELSESQELRADVCVLGAGAAGITIAQELNGSGLDVLLLEGGGFDPTEASIDAYRGVLTGSPLDASGDAALTGTRARYFGGTTNLWGGACRPLRPSDFDRKPWLKHSSWPIGLDDLLASYGDAAEVLGFPSASFNETSWVERGMQPLPLAGNGLTTELLQINPARLGESSRSALTTSSNVTVVINANGVAINAPAAGTAVASLGMATFEGVRFSCKAKAYVLAMGGIENPRLMLASRDERPDGVGNGHDQVGRYFNVHVQGNAGFLLLSGRRTRYDALQPQEVALSTVLSGLRLTDEVIAANESVNSAAIFTPGAFPEASPQQSAGLDATAIAGLLKALNHPPTSTIARVQVSAEQPLDRDSRVTLTNDRDSLGVLRTSLNWTRSPLEKRSVATLFDLLAQALAKDQQGRVQYVLGDVETDGRTVGMDTPPDAVEIMFDDDDALALEASHHHMSATRMSSGPGDGVVDADCRVHELSNLYIAGSSVFATGGISPPTLTIVALALRLARHLSRTVKPS